MEKIVHKSLSVSRIHLMVNMRHSRKHNSFGKSCQELLVSITPYMNELKEMKKVEGSIC